MAQGLQTLWQYAKAKRLQQLVRHWSREQLEQYQQQQLQRFMSRVLVKSPYFSAYVGQPLSAWPLMNKASMMAQFDQMNTAGLSRDVLLENALQAERSRDFSQLVSKYSVGLSSGTSGTRGLFVTSPAERALWSATILSKLLPQGLFAGERVALFLRADNALYQNVNSRFLSFRFFDLLANFDQQCQALEGYQPTILVAPAQVLVALAQKCQDHSLTISPARVISAAEVLSPQDKQVLQQQFGDVAEVYQATEGFLGSTCELGVMHLNEESLVVETEWLDQTRFIPIITDFRRATQPVVRYRLDDVLHDGGCACPCGRPTRVISHIEGRADDQLCLPGVEQPWVTIFADACNRILATALPWEVDYVLEHTMADEVEPVLLRLHAPLSPVQQQTVQQALWQWFATQQVDVQRLRWDAVSHTVPRDFLRKKRRIVRVNDRQRP
ncbi:F390 synthetase-related protein [Paenalcaligenes sp. Me52]|uniref:F390 synthetase-related protein n=1 Tax=Paenalcaligenes sp. Me52 TaxID=3392038 RepID=UPI003D2A0A58